MSNKIAKGFRIPRRPAIDGHAHHHTQTNGPQQSSSFSSSEFPSITRQAALILSAIGRSVDQICGLAQMAIDVADLAD